MILILIGNNEEYLNKIFEFYGLLVVDNLTFNLIIFYAEKQNSNHLFSPAYF